MPITPTPKALIRFGAHTYDTKILVDGHDITQNIPCRAIKVNAVADATEGSDFTKITLQIVGAVFDCEMDIKRVSRALRDEADRLDTLIKG